MNLILAAAGVIAVGEVAALIVSYRRYRTAGLDHAAQVYCIAVPALLLLAALILSLGMLAP